MQGKIIRIVSNQYTIHTVNDGDVLAVAAGKLRLSDKPVVGDEVEFEKIEDKYVFKKVLERKNQLIRPAISNVDQALIVMSAVEPAFSNVLVDRLIFLISYSDIEPVIVISKMDLAKEDDEVFKYIEDYRKSGYTVVTVGHDYDLTELKNVLKGKVSVLAGQSGVGKSTLLNKLDPTFALHTQEISKALNRGKHTTRHTELYPVAEGWLADTPGFSSLNFGYINSFVLAGKIKDFQNAQECRFNDCHHLCEPGCAIIQGVNDGNISLLRYNNYKEIVSQCDKVKDWQ